MKHKHYDLIVAWAEGKPIQYKPPGDLEWSNVTGTPMWQESMEYRVKPTVIAQYRVALINMGANKFDTSTAKNAEDELRAAAHPAFVRWLTDRVEVTE